MLKTGGVSSRLPIQAEPSDFSCAFMWADVVRLSFRPAAPPFAKPRRYQAGKPKAIPSIGLPSHLAAVHMADEISRAKQTNAPLWCKLAGTVPHVQKRPALDKDMHKQVYLPR